MGIFSKSSLDSLREKIDLVEVVSPHVDLRSVGGNYKGICPFHEEKTPSFTIQKGSSHYHCFGCGAHGDAIEFLKSFLHMGFVEAVELLAKRFQVPLKLEKGERRSRRGLLLKEVLQGAMEFYHFYLLHAEEGRAALSYLYNRGIDLDFVRLFHVGYAPKKGALFLEAMGREGYELDALKEVGLAISSDRGKRAFFIDRILFPILDHVGNPIAFSARRFGEGNRGPKYLNTPDTPLFRKSRVLYGLHFSRRRIAREKRALIVEGQIDASRLIQAGLDFTVAGQGSAFTREQVDALVKLGIQRVYLAFDEDGAGVRATHKVGALFQRARIEVKVVSLLPSRDPDAFLSESGPRAFLTRLEEAGEYFDFLFDLLQREIGTSSPVQKGRFVEEFAKEIRSWEDPIIVRESLHRLARRVSLSVREVGAESHRVDGRVHSSLHRTRRGHDRGERDRILETDFLRFLIVFGEAKPDFLEMIRTNLKPEHLRIPTCRLWFARYLSGEAISLALENEKGGMDAEERALLARIQHKRINPKRIEMEVRETIEALLKRHWIEERDRVREEMRQGGHSEEDMFALIKRFNDLTNSPPAFRSAPPNR